MLGGVAGSAGGGGLILTAIGQLGELADLRHLLEKRINPLASHRKGWKDVFRSATQQR
jgi:hypothetical protein